MTPTWLKPMIGALFDTEVIPDAERLEQGVNELKMFVRPVGEHSAYDTRPKDHCDTNMCNAATLPTPIQFAVCGFSLRAEDMDPEDRRQFDAGIFQFRFCGDRIYFDTPIGDMPMTMDTKKDWTFFSERMSDPKAIESMLASAVRYFKEKDAPPLRVVVEGGFAIMILPSEAFYVKLIWDKGLRLKKNATVRAGIWGIRYTPV